MRRKSVIDYDLNSDLTKELKAFLRQRVNDIFGKHISDDYFDYLGMITEKSHKETFDQQRKDI